MFPAYVNISIVQESKRGAFLKERIAKASKANYGNRRKDGGSPKVAITKIQITSAARKKSRHRKTQPEHWMKKM